MYMVSAGSSIDEETDFSFLKEIVSKTEIVSREHFPGSRWFSSHDKQVWEEFRLAPYSFSLLNDTIAQTKSAFLKRLYKIELARQLLLEDRYAEALPFLQSDHILASLMRAAAFEFLKDYRKAAREYRMLESELIADPWGELIEEGPRRVCLFALIDRNLSLGELQELNRFIPVQRELETRACSGEPLAIKNLLLYYQAGMYEADSYCPMGMVSYFAKALQVMDENPSKAIFLAREAYSLGSLGARWILDFYHRSEEEAEKGDGQAKYCMGLRYAEVDRLRTLFWMAKAALDGHRKACRELARACSSEGDVENANYWLQKSRGRMKRKRKRLTQLVDQEDSF